MSTMPPATKRNLRRPAIAIAVYLPSVFAASYLIEHQGVSGVAAYALALIPGVGAAALFWINAKMILETEDEFMRMLAVRRDAMAAGFAISLACVWGFLEQFKLVPHVPAFWIIVLWAIGVFLGIAVNRMTHGVWGPWS